MLHTFFSVFTILRQVKQVLDNKHKFTEIFNFKRYCCNINLKKQLHFKINNKNLKRLTLFNCNLVNNNKFCLKKLRN